MSELTSEETPPAYPVRHVTTPPLPSVIIYTRERVSEDQGPQKNISVIQRNFEVSSKIDRQSPDKKTAEKIFRFNNINNIPEFSDSSKILSQSENLVISSNLVLTVMRMIVHQHRMRFHLCH